MRYKCVNIKIGSRTLASYTYTSRNNYLASLDYGNGDSVDYTYDKQGRVTKQTYEDGDTVTYKYDNNGALATVTDSSSGSITYYYDFASRYTGSRTDQGWSRYIYDNNGRLSRRTFDTPTTGTVYETFTYDADAENSISDGALLYMQMVSGNYLNYSYDSLQRLTNKYIERGSNVDREIWERYTYDNSHVATKLNWIGNTATHSFAYTYDGNGNILTETDTQNGTALTYTYDSANQLTKVTHASGRTEVYSYDDAGNLRSFSNGSISHTYTYGDAEWGDLLTKVDDQEITYDKVGNPLTFYNGYHYTFTWEEGRQLASVTSNNKTTSYQYDFNGIRTKKTNADGSYVVYDLVDGTAVGETRYNANNTVFLYMRYIFDEAGAVNGIGLWYPGDTAWTDYYFAKNLQGDVLEVYQAETHTLVAEYMYDAWGNVLWKSGTLADVNPFRYRSYYYDTETWFYYLQSRYYDPNIGRFINADAYASTGQGILGNNMFAYCGNNPVVLSDPYGYCGCSIAQPRSGAAYTGLCPICGSSGGGTGGGGIAIALEKVGTWILEGTAKIATWAVAASTYAYAQTFADISADRFADQQPRVHHIIPKGKFRWYGPEIVGMMNEMHQMLKDAKININDPENLIIVSHGSHKSMHTRGYIIQIYNIMKQAEDGGRDAVLEALDYARSYVASLDKYANGW